MLKKRYFKKIISSLKNCGGLNVFEFLLSAAFREFQGTCEAFFCNLVLVHVSSLLYLSNVLMSWNHHSTNLNWLGRIKVDRINWLIGSLDLVGVRLPEKLLVVAGRVVVVEGDGAGGLQFVGQLHGRVSRRVVDGRAGEEDGGLPDAVGRGSRDAAVDAALDGSAADERPVTLTPAHDVDDLRSNTQ